MKKVKIKLDDMERRILVKLLYKKRNELIREGRYTDAIDELILKIIDANQLFAVLHCNAARIGFGDPKGAFVYIQRRCLLRKMNTHS